MIAADRPHRSPSRAPRHAELVSASIARPAPPVVAETWTLKQVQGDGRGFAVEARKWLAISVEGSVG